MRPKLYTTAQAAKRIGISRQSLQTWIAAKKVHAPPMVGGNVRLWTEADISKLEKVKARTKKK
jgi:excisionase family DNA binding protein